MGLAGLRPVATTSPPHRMKPPEPRRAAVSSLSKSLPFPDARNQRIVADKAAMPWEFDVLRTGARTLDND
jgi:hypothetical protein